jgi:hypothetical protein
VWGKHVYPKHFAVARLDGDREPTAALVNKRVCQWDEGVWPQSHLSVVLVLVGGGGWAAMVKCVCVCVCVCVRARACLCGWWDAVEGAGAQLTSPSQSDWTSMSM